jgi:hypothetical protein
VYDQLVDRAWLAPWAVAGTEGNHAEVTRMAESMVSSWLVRGPDGRPGRDTASGSSVRSDTIET